MEIKPTPLEYSERLSQKYSCHIFLKREDTHKPIGSVKIRGVYHKLQQLPENVKERGLMTAADHTFALCFSYCCQLLRIKHRVHVPLYTPIHIKQKLQSIGHPFITIYEDGQNYDDCMHSAQWKSIDNGMHFVHPFDDQEIIDGYSDILKEIYQLMNPDIIMVPVSGGGLLSSILLNTDQNSHKVYGVEYNNNKNLTKALIDKVESPNHDNKHKYDCNKLGNIPSEICRSKKPEVISLDENQVAYTVQELHDEDKIITSMNGCMTIAALDHIKTSIIDKTVVCLLTDSNINISEYPMIQMKSDIWVGLTYYFIVQFPQKPNMLRFFTTNVKNEDDDIICFSYLKKSNSMFGSVLIGIKLGSHTNLDRLKSNMKKNGFEYKKIKPDDQYYDYLV